MPEYGSHPTSYEDLTDESLYEMYRQENFQQLSESEKQQLMQETVNRDAKMKGEIGQPEVVVSDLPANTAGESSDGVIYVSRSLVNGEQKVQSNGQELTHDISDNNMQTLNTIFHENRHCYQEQVLDHTIENDPNYDEFAKNSFDVRTVNLDGEQQSGLQYMRGENGLDGYFLYSVQPTERDASLSAERHTEDVMRSLEEKGQTEESFSAYREDIQANGYHAIEAQAQEYFNDPNLTENVDQALSDSYNGTLSDNPSPTASAVYGEMSASYESYVQDLNDALGLDDTGTDMGSDTGGLNAGSGSDGGGIIDPDDAGGIDPDDDDGLQL